jgi:hypothetical protein
MKKLSISHSQVSKYGMCPTSYKYHYVNRLRPKITTGALLFGSALDGALNKLLLNEGSPEEEFTKLFTDVVINEQQTYAPTSTNIVYANADYDGSLLIEEDFDFLESLAFRGIIKSSQDYIEDFLVTRRKKTAIGFSLLHRQEKILYNAINWLCLQRKGFVMLNAYRKKVMPLFDKVHCVQKKIDLVNEDGDTMTGFVDLIADVKGHGTVVLDNKTASKEYDKDAVLTSPQLALYMHSVNDEYKTRKAGFIVMKKSLITNTVKTCVKCGNQTGASRYESCNNTIEDKRCKGEFTETYEHDADIQILIDEIPEITENIVMENLNAVNQSIKSGIFPRNFNSCNNYFGGKCAYFDKCFNNKNEGLEYIPEKKEEAK